MDYGRRVTLDVPYEEAVPQVKEAFKEQGFGTLTEIDVKATLKEKIGVEIDPYLILGTCNPNLAQKAIEAEPSIGLLLPCNVVVRATDGGTLVEAMNPEVIAKVPENPALDPIAQEAGQRIDAALRSLTSMA